MFIRAVTLLSLLVLAACRFESTADLRQSTKPYKPSGAFPIGEYLFQTRDQNRLMVMQVRDETATLIYQNEGNSPDLEQVVSLLDSPEFPDRMFVAVALGGKSKEGVQSYYYYPFSFGKTHIEWYRPAQVTKVFGLADLTREMASMKSGTVFRLVPRDQQVAVMDRFKQWRARTAAEQKKKQNNTAQASPSAPPMVDTQPTINGLTIGDGVYVQGAFSDQPSVIQQIDTANGQVKVRRYSDGVSEWVPANRLISRDQSTANDVARTGVVIGAFVCMISPDTCKNAAK